ncbi:gdsl lipase acylhydrolase [Fusarium langsethiae]|uniref:Gdsl lipase acylhydrolase n=1 Tax=Fusarium langsethiae TaxID=179993 RepID=A0A0M9F669_FUSLA|nr:gdsl lipase acylhydrolase [Fusarium langsethiae]GKT98388.1 unnamed protein product [Fusarium langsethiae]GKU13128.1 unnamed protein product [Fusarium langsethiae]
MPRKKLSILCFGDSLTSGYFCQGLESHPYALKLEDRLAGTFPEVDFEIVVNGYPGDVVSSERFSNRVKSAWRARTYDWTIVLGGTNDIAIDMPPEVIFSSLKKTYDLARDKGAKVLALTVPECSADNERTMVARNALNQRILKNKSRNYYAFDLKSKIPFHSLSQQDRHRYWDDHVHLRREGYDWMGNHVADALIDILWSEGTFEQPSGPSDEVDMEEEFVYDEEDGNPRIINEGYIVVRKKDLD